MSASSACLNLDLFLSSSEDDLKDFAEHSDLSITLFCDSAEAGARVNSDQVLSDGYLFYVKIPAGSGTHAEGVQGKVWLYTVRELYTLWQVHPAGFGQAHCFLPLGTRAAVALPGCVVHGVEGDCSGLY